MPQTLAQAIAQVESSGNPHAQRFESTAWAAQIASPGATWMQPAIGAITAIHACSHETAVQIACTSYGLYQEMGFNLWNPTGFTYHGDNVDFCSSPAAQGAAFQDFCSRNGIAWSAEELLGDPTKLLAFATAYNGPGNPQAYAARVRAALESAG